jgi:hypothetical protein
MTLSVPERPAETIDRLLSALLPVSTAFDVVPRKRLHWNYRGKPQFYLFLEDEISVLRALDGLVIATAYDPHLFGIAESMQPLHCHNLRIDTQARLMRIDADLAKEKFTELNLWQDVSLTLSYFTSYLFYRDALVVQQRTYSVIRNHLMEMIHLPLETRLRVSILEYIQERTYLSRSSVLNMIFALKEANYLATKRGGYLLDLAELPESF